MDLTDFSKELIVEDENMKIDHIDYGQDGFVYYFATYKGNSDESGEYLNRVNLSKKVVDEDDADADLGYEIELVGILKDEHKEVEEEEE